DEILRDQGQLQKAVRYYREVLKREPENAATHERLAFLLSATGQSWQAGPHFFFLVRSGSANYRELSLFSDLGRPAEQREFLETCAKESPQDPFVRLGLASHAFWDGNRDDAESLLRELVADHPELESAQAIWGEILVEGTEKTFRNWHQQVPKSSNDPDLWYVRGLWARRKDKLELASLCFLEALRRAPTHRRAYYQMGQILGALKDQHAVAVKEYSLHMSQLTQTVDNVLRSEGQDEEAIQTTCRILLKMGRIWEGCAWAVIARERFPKSRWHHKLLSEYASLLEPGMPQVLETRQPLATLDRSGNLDLSRLFSHGETAQQPTGKAFTRGPVRFEICEAGPQFTYQNADDPSTPGVRMFESNGGGIAALDFDADGFCDLYLTQGADWPNGAPQPKLSTVLTDRLFRFQGNRFVDISQAAFDTACQDFGQGVSAGDFDNDGFPDLYIANYGENRLYFNNGDGTYSDATSSAGLNGEQWTSSCLIADLNGDSFPDLYAVNYLTGDDLHEIICDGNACSPKNFDGALDRIFQNQGDGTFVEITGQVSAEKGKGLGIVAANIFRDGRLSLFIANDQVANFLLKNESRPGGGEITFREQAFLSGVGFNVDGLPMACMGIAADDIDGNGLIDFFVTNFKDEANTLYLQDFPGYFVDVTAAQGLFAPSYDHVGWGTQFLDADCDGHPDLVIANGHVDDYRDKGGEYHMHPQFFRNTGTGQFQELSAPEVGEYFSRKHLGRGLIKLDWNRDGLMDFAVSHINSPMALLTNQTASPGHFVGFHLRAVKSARDAVGTEVTVTTATGKWTKSVTAGDGFQASNERLLHFGLGDAHSIRQVEIRWPSGTVQRLKNIPSDTTWILVETLSTATVLSDGSSRSWPLGYGDE
ncbi:MAG: VCBS repeat-containing protein, partial [Planctomycetaceae bacterium]|nr:VCBS repeat-containing protein [Planctomycetaceae bacterium]